ncbi:hypothetical protein BG006_000936 [Podila minutissima]|uniref:Snurportin-1 n=1 Tax=Podila minutissima TaxID=64525 RepID=A0A9P5SDL8_9FUNG|nr:hypothetical protein BG006_000936 [Podila minutissima]
MSGKNTQDNKPKGPSPVPLPTASHAPASIAGISLSSTLPTSIGSSTCMSHTTPHEVSNPAMTTTRRKSSTISQVAVDALGDLLESASVLSACDSQEQRRKLNYKSTALIVKTLKQTQEERRRQALAEQAKKRYQFTNHARRLALFSSGKHTDEGSESEEDDNEEEEDEEGSEEDEEDEDDEAKDEGLKSKKSKKAKSFEQEKDASTKPHLTGEEDTAASVPVKHKRRLSSGSESEAGEGGQKGAKRRDADALSPKKPRLQKTSPKPGKKKKRDRNLFSDQLMMPEVMTEIPLDLDTSYYIVPLPIGHRCFVISADGKTIARLPSGQLLVAPFESCLPAGSATYRGNRRADYCILDCVYSSVTRTFWTLDIMCWRGHPVYECETEFRFWWLRGKLAEIETLQAKWIATQTKEWEASQLKKRNRRAKQAKRRQEKAAAAAMDITSTEVPEANGSKATLPSSRKQHDGDQDGDDGDDEAGLEGMDVEDIDPTSASVCSSKGHPGEPNKFWPVAFTPLPYFNASTDLIRLLAESMYHPNNASSTTISPGQDLGLSIPSMTPKSTSSARTPAPTSLLGTMALSGEIATAASLFPAHDNAQKARQDKTLSYERAGGLVFFNKKTMYVLGTTPLCGWVAIEQIGDVFFGEEGGLGPVPGTSAAEGREVEMEDALERIRI